MIGRFRVRAIVSVLIVVVASGVLFLLHPWRPDVASTDPVTRNLESKLPSIALSDDQISQAQIGLDFAKPAVIAKRLIVPGTIIPDASRVARVSVKLAGTVAELRKNIGDEVRKGEILAIVESSQMAEAKSEYLAARLSNELQQELTSRDKLLWEGRAAPEQQYIKSRNAAAQTEMRFSIARQKLLALGVSESEIVELPNAPDGTLRSQNIFAPISGRIAERKVEIGMAVGRDSLETELFAIVELSRVWTELSVSSSDLQSVREGQTVSIAPPAIPGKIIFVSPLLEKETRSARVVAEFDNASGTLRPGSFVTATILLEERRVNVAVPISAIQTLDEKKVVFLKVANGFDRREVVVGQRDRDMVEVVSGLAEGDQIAASNTFVLKAEVSKPALED